MSENQSNIEGIKNHMIMFLLLFLFKSVLSFIDQLVKTRKNSNGKNSIFTNNKPSNEMQKMISKIQQLKQEEDRLNTPSQYVEYTLVRREIIKLEKELSKTMNLKHQPNTLIENNDKKNYSLPINLQSLIINIAYWAINLFILINTRGVYLSLSYNQYSMNVIINYYHQKEEEIVNIPLSVILFTESIALNQLTKIINTLYPL